MFHTVTSMVFSSVVPELEKGAELNALQKI